MPQYSAQSTPWGYGTCVRKRLTPIAVIAVFGLIVFGMRWLSEPPPEPPSEEPASDTGMSETEREAFMRTIGYVQ